ncbi:MAG: hypothetical protein FD121_1663, partial [Gallionellaceae bacterium]
TSNLIATADLFINGNDINLGTGTATTTISGGFGIGVGTTTPGAAFAVATSTAGLNTAFLLSNLGSGYTFWAQDEANDTSPFVIDASGNVGIATSTPGSLFSIQGVGNFVSGATSTIYTGVNFPVINATSTTATSTFGNGIQLSNGCFKLPNGLCAGTAGSGGGLNPGIANRLAYYSTTGTIDSANFLTVDTANARIGISSTTPSAALSVMGTVYLDTTFLTLGSTTGAQVGTASSSLTIHYRQAATTTFATSSVNAFSFSIATNTTPILSIDTANSRVGIGTGTPGSLFSIHGGNAQITGTTTSHALVATSTLFVGATGDKLIVTQGGNVGIGTVGPVNTLDVNGTMAIGSYAGVNTGPSNGLIVSGNVGIGTANPGQVLTVSGNIFATSNLIATADLFINGNDINLGINGNDINLGTGTATSTISGGFGIGVGTTTPGAAFAIATSGANTAMLLSNTGTGYTFWAEDSANDTTPFVIDAGGNVGIGTAYPGASAVTGLTGVSLGARLHVTVGSGNGSIIVQSNNTSEATIEMINSASAVNQ